MARDILYAEIARQRELELRRGAERQVRLPAPGSETPIVPREPVTIRLAALTDRRELDLMARRNGVAVPAGRRLIAELGGTAVAAMSLQDRSIVADSGAWTSDVVELLRLRAAQLLGETRSQSLSSGVLARLRRALTALQAER